MKKLKKGFAFLLALALMVNGFYIDSLSAKAADASIDITFQGLADGATANDGKVQVDAGGGWIDVTKNTTGVTAQKVRIVPNEGKEVDWTAFRLSQGGADVAKDSALQDALVSGEGYALVADSTYRMENVEFRNAGGGPGGPGGEDGCHHEPPTVTDPEDITISVTGYEDNFFTRDSEIKIDNFDAKSGSVTTQQADTHTILLQPDFGAAFSKIVVNGVEYTPTPDKGDHYEVSVPDASSYSVEVFKGVSDDVTIVWAYDHDNAVANYGNDDAWVENGRIELVSVTRGGVSQDVRDFDVREDGGDLFLKRGDDIVLRLIPEYGYQLDRVNINGENLVPDDDNVSTFAIHDLQNNLHFRGVFVPAEDDYDDSSSLIDRPFIGNGQNAASSGVIKMTVADNSTYATDVTAAVEGEGVEKIGSLDISLENKVSKGTEGQYWTSAITEFTDPIAVSMDIDFTLLGEGETFSIVRDHEGSLSEISATIFEEEGRIEFETNQFSTYTIVKKMGEHQLPPAPEVHEGDFGFLFDNDFVMNEEDGSVSVREGFVPCNRAWKMVGDMMSAYFYSVNAELELMPDGLFSDGGLRGDIAIRYSADGTAWRDASYSVAMGGEWDVLDTTVDLRIREIGQAVFEFAFCREGSYQIVRGDGQHIDFEVGGRPMLLTHDSEPGYYYSNYDFADNDTFTITPGPDVTKYAIVIQSRFGFGADGNQDNYFFTATSNEANVTNKLLYINGEDPMAAPYRFGTETVVLKASDFASKAEVFVKFAMINPENGQEEEYIESYYLKTNAGDRDDDAYKVHFNKKDEQAQAFQCFAVTKEEYNQDSVDYFLRKPLYISYGKTMAEAIDVMVEQMEKGTVPNLGYLLIRSKVALNNEEEVALSKTPQYVSTPDNVKGVVLTCQEMDYVVKVKNSFASVNGGKDFEEWVSWTAPAEGAGELKYLIQVVPKSDTYYELTGSYEEGNFSIKDGTPLIMGDKNGMPVLMIDGREYLAPLTCVTEYQLPEIHVDATTEIHLVGSFIEYDNDQPSIFLNLPEGSNLQSIVNGNVYTSADMGETHTENSTFHSWYSGDVECEYTVKIDMLETKTAFAADEQAGVTAAETDVPVDALFAQLTGANSQLTAAEKSEVAAGKNITVTVDISAETTTTESMATAVADEYANSAVQYMNIDLLYHVGFDDVADKNITETAKDVNMVFTMSDDFYKEGTQYVILREHDGVVEELECIQEGNQIGFATNKFSSYAIVEKKHTHIYGSDFDQTCNLCGKERDGQFKLEQKKVELTDAVIATVLKDKGYDTVAKVENALLSKIEETIASANATVSDDEKIAVDGTVYMDIIVEKYSVDGGATYIQGMPTVGTKFTILIPFPEGTNKTFHFMVAHMISSGDKVGMVEMPSIFVTDLGIEVTMENGLSPIAVSWTKPAPQPDGGTNPGSGNTTPTAPTPTEVTPATTPVKSPKTGDTNGFLLWSILMAVGIGAMGYGYKKKRQTR